MKFLFFLAGIILPLFLHGQDSDPVGPKRNVLKIAPQQFRVKSLKLGVEHFNASFTHSYSLYATIRKEKDNQIDNPVGYDGLGGEFHYRTYLKPLKSYATRNNKTYTQGIYLSGFIQGHAFSGDQYYQFREFDSNSGEIFTTEYRLHESIGNWATGFTIGLQHVFWQILTVDVYVGGGIQWSDVISSGTLPPNYFFTSPTYDYEDPRFNGILPKVGAQIGIGL